MSASANIWGLVSGFPGMRRRNRLLAMFQAFLDESATGSVHEGLFVMAGYVATAEKWAAFSDEWQQHLDYRSPHFRNIEAFHWAEMLSSPGDRERIGWFYRIIEDHVHAAMAVIIDMRALNRVFNEFPWPQDKRQHLEPLRNPYYIAFHSVLTGMPKGQNLIGVDSPIDFFFDDNSNKERCLRGWDLLKRSARPELLALMGETPAFRDDKKVLPLQAADLWSGITRTWAEKTLGLSDSIPDLTWPTSRLMPVLSIFLDEDKLRRRYELVIQEFARRIASGEI